MSSRKYGQKTDKRNPDGTFANGNPGKPMGSRHRATLAIENLLEGDAERLGRKAIELALEGDTTALRLCLERIAPPKKDGPVEFDMPSAGNVREAATVAQAVLSAVSAGSLNPADASTMMSLVERYGRLLATSEIEGRIEALERATGAAHQ